MQSSGVSTYWHEVRSNFLKGILISFVLLQLLFLGNLCYLYATQFHESERVSALNLLYVDYDRGIVGQSVLDAYAYLRGNNFPTLEQSPVNQFPELDDVRIAVCKGHYWAAIYTNPGASANLSSALARGTSTPDTLTYIWNGARYPAFSLGSIYSNIIALTEATRSAYYSLNGSNLVQSGVLSSVSSLEIFLDPIQASEINIKATTQGTRVLYNTITMVMPIIQQFFFMMALNGISGEFRIFSKLSRNANGLLRMVLSVTYTLIGSLCTTGYIWAFRESWAVNGNQFVLTWMMFWLYSHINFLLMDILTTWVPMQFMPFCVLTWVIINVASCISPFELSPGFYRWAYALPAHEMYQVLIQIWSDGCGNQLHIALPVLFSWWVLGMVLVIVAVFKRCRMACTADADAVKIPPVDDSFEVGIQDQAQRCTSNRRSSAIELVTNRVRTVESIQLEREAYGPSFPTPLVHNDQRS